MRRMLGAAILGLGLLANPAVTAWSDDPEGEKIADATGDEGGNRNLILAAIAVVVVVGGGIALSRRK